MSEAWRQYVVDLHVHTVLSPCGGLDMGAPDIVAQALAGGIQGLGITDHNSCGNVRAVMEAAKGSSLRVFPGLEVQTEEDIHVVTLFPDLPQARAFECWLRKGFLSIENNPDVFGEQLFVDKDNGILGEEETLLVHGVRYSVEEVLRETHAGGGLAILAHVDRPSFSYVAVLGDIPPELPVDGVELSRGLSASQARKWRERLGRAHTFLRSSDSHTLETLEASNASRMRLRELSFSEIALALAGAEGREIFWPWGAEDSESDETD